MPWLDSELPDVGWTSEGTLGPGIKYLCFLVGCSHLQLYFKPLWSYYYFLSLLEELCIPVWAPLKSEEDMVPCSDSLYFIPLRQGLSLTCLWAGRMKANKSSDPPVSVHVRQAYEAVPNFFTWALGFWTQEFTLALQVLLLREPSSQPVIIFDNLIVATVVSTITCPCC